MGLTFVYLALPTCLVVYIQKLDFHLINVFCIVVVVKKCTMSNPGSLLLFCRRLHSSKKAFGAYDQSYTFV